MIPPPRPSAEVGNPSRVGHLWNSRGAPSYHGNSYFGHQAAASLMEMESPELPVGLQGIHAGHATNPNVNISRRLGGSLVNSDVKGPYDHIWELVGYLPRRKAVADSLVQGFLTELNPVYDSVHEETFLTSYEAFWDRRWGDDDLTTVDLRWLALLFMILSFAELLACPAGVIAEAQQRSSEERSVQFFWASRKAIVLAPTFSGESPDLVRAGILVSRYLIQLGRKTEGWLTSSFAIRMAQAQGMHIDGESWGLPPRVLEIRRRLWCKLYALDRSISLAVGRPYTIHHKHCMEMRIRNVWVDDKTDQEAVESSAQERPLSDPTRSVYYMFHQRLSTILGDIHDECFALLPLTTSHSAYEKVLMLDNALVSWAISLPVYFRLERPDKSMDADRPFLYWQRLYLHSAYHFARVTLHRGYVLLESATDRFSYSREACLSSACADLGLKLGLRHATMADRLNAGGAMHNLFDSALVLGIMVVRDLTGRQTAAIVEDLAAYCEKQRADPWVNEFALAEVKVIELCVAKARRSTNGGHDGGRLPDAHAQGADHVQSRFTDSSQRQWSTDLGAGAGSADTGSGDHGDSWLDDLFGPTRTFPQPVDYQFWEDLVGTLDARV